MHTADPKLKWHVFALAAAMLALGAPPLNELLVPWLRYDRALVEAGQVWRLLTCHLVHFNHWHLLMNVSGFVLCWFFFVDVLTRARLWLWWLVSSLLVGVAFYLFDTTLQRYVGLSGILHGFLVLCLLLGWRSNPWLHTLVLAVVIGRLTWEQMPGYDVYYLRDVIGGRVHVNAHLYGSVVGAVLGGSLCLTTHLQQKRKHPACP